MSDYITYSATDITVNGVKLEGVESFGWKSKHERAPELRSANFSAEFDFQVEGDASAFFAAFGPTGYWLRRQTYSRRKLWRQVARQLRVPLWAARRLCNTGDVEVDR